MADPLLQTFQLKHLHLKNRIITTSHEPAYNEGGFQKRDILLIIWREQEVE